MGLSPRVFPEAASDRSPRSSSPTPARGLLGPRHRPLRNPVPTPSLGLPGPRAPHAVGLAVRVVGVQEWGAASAARRGRAPRRVGASTLALSVYTRANHRPEPAVHRQHGRTSFPGQESGRILGLSRPWHLHVLRPGTLTPSPALARGQPGHRMEPCSVQRRPRGPLCSPGAGGLGQNACLPGLCCYCLLPWVASLALARTPLRSARDGSATVGSLASPYTSSLPTLLDPGPARPTGEAHHPCFALAERALPGSPPSAGAESSRRWCYTS